MCWIPVVPTPSSAVAGGRFVRSHTRLRSQLEFVPSSPQRPPTRASAPLAAADWTTAQRGYGVRSAELALSGRRSETHLVRCFHGSLGAQVEGSSILSRVGVYMPTKRNLLDVCKPRCTLLKAPFPFWYSAPREILHLEEDYSP